MKYEKDLYKKLELSYYEIQLIASILDTTKRKKGDWFTETNLKDVSEMFQEIIIKR